MSRIITQEIVDFICPEHGRTSCSDSDLGNSYGGWSGRFDEQTGNKEVYYPRCNRCYLMDHIGEDMDLLEFDFDYIILRWMGDERNVSQES